MNGHLVIVLGDQLDRGSAAFDGFDRRRDRVWMAEVAGESTHVWSHKARIAVFLSGMRHFRDRLRDAGVDVDYTPLPPQASAGEHDSLADALAASLARDKAAGRAPDRLVVVEPGEWRVRQALEATALNAGIPLDIRTDRHFFSSREEFAEHARGRKQLRLEYFYRPLRQRHDVLMDDGEPAGGQWNFDAENRGAFPAAGPGRLCRSSFSRRWPGSTATKWNNPRASVTATVPSSSATRAPPMPRSPPPRRPSPSRSSYTWPSTVPSTWPQDRSTGKCTPATMRFSDMRNASRCSWVSSAGGTAVPSAAATSRRSTTATA